jgi:hypothetical protein
MKQIIDQCRAMDDDVTTVYVLRVGGGAAPTAHLMAGPVAGIYDDRHVAVDEGLRLLAEHPDADWYCVTAATRRRQIREVRVEVVG